HHHHHAAPLHASASFVAEHTRGAPEASFSELELSTGDLEALPDAGARFASFAPPPERPPSAPPPPPEAYAPPQAPGAMGRAIGGAFTLALVGLAVAALLFFLAAIDVVPPTALGLDAFFPAEAAPADARPGGAER
ncbi:MAG: hypothetical protein AAGH15_10145, partial [Myxococcota bacterium]